MIPVASVSYMTAAGSENPGPDAAIRGRPKKPVLPTAVATIRAPARGALHAPDAHRHPADAEQGEVDGEGRHRDEQQGRVEVAPSRITKIRAGSAR